MVASYSVEGDSFTADKPRRWSDARFDVCLRRFVSVLIFNFFDDLKRIAP